ncbi:hypothetical protein RB195_003437 [Necator americanus]|uniref:Uncharacterized protein n=1 Tax=Necator americanus TaxID=51031 RepID=A0ABR1DNK4_NECAM
MDAFHKELEEVIHKENLVIGYFNAKLAKATEEKHWMRIWTGGPARNPQEKASVYMGIAQRHDSCGDRPHSRQPEVVST